MSQPDLAEQIMNLGRRARRGSLCMFGNWFGRPFDSRHECVAASMSDRLLTLEFKNDKVLEVWDPEGFYANEDSFEIRRASRVRWRWYQFGRPQTEENRKVMEFWVEDGQLKSISPWPRPLPEDPAVELI